MVCLTLLKSHICIYSITFNNFSNWFINFDAFRCIRNHSKLHPEIHRPNSTFFNWIHNYINPFQSFTTIIISWIDCNKCCICINLRHLSLYISTYTNLFGSISTLFNFFEVVYCGWKSTFQKWFVQTGWWYFNWFRGLIWLKCINTLKWVEYLLKKC